MNLQTSFDSMSGKEKKPDELEPTEKPSDEETHKELEEAQHVNELREAGMTVEKIAERLGASESTIRRRLDLWNSHIGREPAEKDDIDRITSVITEFFGSDDAAERIGEVTGTNVAVIKGILDRIRKGNITKGELSRLLHNIKGGVIAYFGAGDIFKRFEELFLPKRHPYSESEIDRALKKKIEANPKKKKKKKTEQVTA